MNGELWQNISALDQHLPTFLDQVLGLTNQLVRRATTDSGVGTDCEVRNTTIGPRATRALPRLKNMVFKVVKMGT
jgi:hypothetical protein